MARYVLRLSYHGGPFRGFAQNEGVPTIGGVLRVALETMLQHPVGITCAGRTDAGVHAHDQVVHFTTDKPVDPEAMRGSLNALCRPHIVIAEVRPVSDTFDARFSCIGRAYRYRVLNRRLPDPFRREYTWRVVDPLDRDLMQAAGELLLGTHDFTSFCRRQYVSYPGETRVEKPRTRTLRSVQWTRQPDDELHLEIAAQSFCQQMVRSITGLCVDAGMGRVELEEIPEILAAKDRLRVPRVAPPEGLFLESVTYPPGAMDL